MTRDPLHSTRPLQEPIATGPEPFDVMPLLVVALCLAGLVGCFLVAVGGV